MSRRDTFVVGEASAGESNCLSAPPTPARFTANLILTGRGAVAVAAPATAPPGSDIVVSKFAVKHDDSKLLQLFETAFGTHAEDEIVQAGGSGLAFIPLISARGAAASGRAKALVLTKFTAFVAGGVSGELTVESNRDYFTTYDRLKRVLPAANRPAAGVETEMVSTIAHSDPGIRELWYRSPDVWTRGPKR